MRRWYAFLSANPPDVVFNFPDCSTWRHMLWTAESANYIVDNSPNIKQLRLVGLGVWFSLWVREVPGSNPGRALSFSQLPAIACNLRSRTVIIRHYHTHTHVYFNGSRCHFSSDEHYASYLCTTPAEHKDEWYSFGRVVFYWYLYILSTKINCSFILKCVHCKWILAPNKRGRRKFNNCIDKTAFRNILHIV